MIRVLLLAILTAACQPLPRNVWESQYKTRSPEEMAAQFESESRPVFRHRTAIVDLLDLQPGQSVAEIGAGSGFISRMIAAAVGPTGQAVATELDRSMVEYMNVRARKEGLQNFIAQLGASDSTALEPASVDTIVIVNTFSFFERRSDMMRSIAAALRPHGLLVVIDFRRRGDEGIDPQTVSDLAVRAGLTRVDESAPVPEHYALRFRKGLASAPGRRVSMEDARQRCVVSAEVKLGESAGSRDCRVSDFGEIGVVDNQAYFYAVYCVVPDYSPSPARCGDGSPVAAYYAERALAVFARDAPQGDLKVLFERFEGSNGDLLYGKPGVFRTPSGTILYLPIAVDGTGHFNESEYYIREAGRWERLDSTAWVDVLTKRIPAGLEIWKGIWPDVRTLRAEASLYQKGDSNCCPTGGVARIQLTIRAKRFVLESVVFERAPFPAETGVPR